MNDTSNSSTSGSSGGADASARDNAALALKSSLVDGAHDVTDNVKHLAEGVIGQTRKSAET